MGKRTLQFCHSCEEGSQRRQLQIEPLEGFETKRGPKGLVKNLCPGQSCDDEPFSIMVFILSPERRRALSFF